MAKNGTFKVTRASTSIVTSVATYAAKSDISTGMSGCASNVLKVVSSAKTGYIALTTDSSHPASSGIKMVMGGTTYYLMERGIRNTVTVTMSEKVIPSEAKGINIQSGSIRGGGGMGGSGRDGGDGGRGYDIDGINYYGGGGGGSGGSGYAGSAGTQITFSSGTSLSYYRLRIAYGIGGFTGWEATATRLQGRNSSEDSWSNIYTASGGSKGSDGDFPGGDGGDASPSSGGTAGSDGGGYDSEHGDAGGYNYAGARGISKAGQMANFNGGDGGRGGAGGDGGPFDLGNSGDPGEIGYEGNYGTGSATVEYWT